ncbi:MAG: hypothetical protein ACPGTU_04455 [Myxococcota bacterium]
MNSPTQPPSNRSLHWYIQRLFRKQNRGLFVVLPISLFLLFGGPGYVINKLEQRRCTHACETYMSGRPGAQWVAPHANGAGYGALLSCMSDSLQEQQGYDCWKARVVACTNACVLDPDAGKHP